ncbi:MAG: PAS domain S-box protein, partial [Rickettsiales bacterium]|nr:PAS domain S-box protein [Rickettsiales bacterium]
MYETFSLKFLTLLEGEHKVIILHQILMAFASAYVFTRSISILVQFGIHKQKKQIALILGVISLSMALWSINLSNIISFGSKNKYNLFLVVTSFIISGLFAYLYYTSVEKYQQSRHRIILISIIFAFAQYCIYYVTLMALELHNTVYISSLSVVSSIVLSAGLFVLANYILCFYAKTKRKYTGPLQAAVVILIALGLLTTHYVSKTFGLITNENLRTLNQSPELPTSIFIISFISSMITVGIALFFLYSQLRKTIKYFGITVKISIIFITLTITSVIVTTYGIHHISNDYVEESGENASNNKLSLARLYINQFTDNLVNNALFMSQNETIRTMLDKEQFSDTEAMYKLQTTIHPLLHQNPEYVQLHIAKTTSETPKILKVYYKKGITYSSFSDQADENILKLLEDTRKFAKGDSYIPPVTLHNKTNDFIKHNDIIIQASVPLFSKEGIIQGTLILTATLGQNITKLVDSLDNDANVFIVNNLGSLLKLSLSADLAHKIEYNSQELVQHRFPVLQEAFEISSRSSETQTNRLYKTDEHIITFTKIPLNNDQNRFLGVIKVFNKDNMKDFSIQLQLYVFIISGTLIMLSLACATIFARHITRPIENITKCAVSFSHGEDQSQLLPLKNNDEVGILARALQYLHKQNVLKSQELEQSEHRFRHMFEYSPIGLVLSHADGQLIQANRSFYSILGYQEEYDAQNTITFNVHEGWHDELMESIAKTGYYGPYEQVYIHKDGREVPIIISSILVENKNASEYIWSFVQDITESKAKQNELDEYHHHLEDLIKERTKDLELMKEKAEEAIEIKSEFLSNITHELRTPLHAILSFARIGKQRAETIPADKIQEFFDDIHVSGNRLLVLVNNLLDLSKADAGKIVLEKRSHDMKVTIDQALKELSSLCEDKEITILQEIEKKKFVTKYDHGRILQVMINLISNALKFSPKFSTITIECD